MGQQQLLLLVLGAIIVGVAIVVGINMFSSGATNANRDAVVQDCMTLATRAQQWYRTPLILNGGGRDFTNISCTTIRFPQANENGANYAIAGAGQTANISATGREPSPANPLTVTLAIWPDSIGVPVVIVP